jgi:peptide/nickel transport system permease protein
VAVTPPLPPQTAIDRGDKSVSKKLEYVARRLLRMLLVLWAVATILFLIFRLMPGNPLAAFLDPNFTAEQQAGLMKEFGLDQPLWMQYLIFLKNLATGNLGASFFYKQPVSKVLRQVLPNTLWLTGFSLIVAYAFGVVGGVLLAWFRGSWLDKLGTTFVLMTRSAPEFWVGMVALAVFSFKLGLFPGSGVAQPGSLLRGEWQKLFSVDFWHHLALPGLTLALYLCGLPLLLMRTNMLDVLGEEHITMSRMKGFSEWRIMLRHAARNALLPVMTALAVGVGYAIGGNVVIETVYSWPGLGQLLVKAVAQKDYPLAQGAFFVIAVVMILMNLLADFMYSVLDPRVGTGRR